MATVRVQQTPPSPIHRHSRERAVLNFAMAAGAAAARWSDLDPAWRRAGERRAVMREVAALCGIPDWRSTLLARPSPADRRARLLALAWTQPQRGLALLARYLDRDQAQIEARQERLYREEAELAAETGETGGDAAENRGQDWQSRRLGVDFGRMELRFAENLALKRAFLAISRAEFDLSDLESWAWRGKAALQPEVWAALVLIGIQTALPRPCPILLAAHGPGLEGVAEGSLALAESLVRVQERASEVLEGERKGSFGVERVLRSLQRSPGQGTMSLADSTGFSVQGIAKIVPKLVEAGVIRDFGSRAHPVYDLGVVL